jgi:uncharacterized protein (TIGR00369 family)
MAPKERVVTDGEFAGWIEWLQEPFDEKAGPFFHRREADGRLIAAFRANRSHTNGLKLVHGGCLLTLADYALFTVAVQHCNGDEAVTISLNGEFLGSARENDLIVAHPEIVKLGRSMVFARGLLKANDKPILSFSGAMMRVKG